MMFSRAITFGIILGETVMREMRLKDMSSMIIVKNSADYTMRQLSIHHMIRIHLNITFR